jgi:hypothetical protein
MPAGLYQRILGEYTIVSKICFNGDKTRAIFKCTIELNAEPFLVFVDMNTKRELKRVSMIKSNIVIDSFDRVYAFDH